MTVPETATELRQVANSFSRELLAADGRAAARRPDAQTWSPKEVLGHLIDSAANNHQRFVRAQETDALTVPGYEQNHWVESQGYQEADWPHLDCALDAPQPAPGGRHCAYPAGQVRRSLRHRRLRSGDAGIRHRRLPAPRQAPHGADRAIVVEAEVAFEGSTSASQAISRQSASNTMQPDARVRLDRRDPGMDPRCGRSLSRRTKRSRQRRAGRAGQGWQGAARAPYRRKLPCSHRRPHRR